MYEIPNLLSTGVSYAVSLLEDVQFCVYDLSQRSWHMAKENVRENEEEKKSSL